MDWAFDLIEDIFHVVLKSSFGVFLFFCVVVFLVVGTLRGRSRRKNCTECSKSNPFSSQYCSSCGEPFARAVRSESFYSELRQRISNWQMWGWLKEGESDRLAELHERDLQVFRQGTGTSPVKAGGDDEPQAAVVSAAEAEVDQEDVITAVDVSALASAHDPPVGEKRRRK